MKQRGVALLGILVVVSLVTVLAVNLAHSNLVRLDTVERRQESVQAWQIWRAGLEWSRDILREDLRLSQIDHPGEAWARGIRDYPAEGGALTGLMEDQQGRFNLNNLARDGKASEPDLAVFRRLLTGVGLDAGLAAAVADWIDADRAALPGGAEDADYARLQPPYRAANRPLAHLAELYQVRGFDAAAVERLRPYITVLPAATAVNVNSASPDLLAALLPTLDAEQIEDLARAREARPFADLTAFHAALPGGTQVDGGLVQLGSRYFLLRLGARYGQARAEGEALLERASGLPRLVWQARGLTRPLRVDNPLSEAEMRMGNP